MLGEDIYKRIKAPEFRPFYLVMASGERVFVRHPDSISFTSTEYKGKRIFGRSFNVLEIKDGVVVERYISLPMVAQILDEYPLDGSGLQNAG
ncbi:MAG TPA: hypothetical protein VD997_17120 [Phycisphaerales bacterium]|nr:hypothetical protein [Phycisphaerales bacterium]